MKRVMALVSVTYDRRGVPVSQFMRGQLWAGIVVSVAFVLLAAACTGGGAERVRADRRLPILVVREKIGDSGEADRLGGPAAEEYENRALPRTTISFKQAQGALHAFRAVPTLHAPGSLAPSTGNWQQLGPVTPNVPALVTYTNRATTNSGRVTALAIGPTCQTGTCKLWVGAAGGGVWYTKDALAAKPSWQSFSKGMTSNSIGSLVLDPNDPSGNTLYAGTGEPNGSSDSEAGVGLFKSTNGGSTWSLVSGSVAVAKDRSIASIAIDPANPSHYYIGTAVARHGLSSATSGRRTPPNAPTLGLYETTNGGQSFSLIFSQPGNPSPASSGVDWFQGGVNNIHLDPNDPATVYAAVIGYGLWRRSVSLDGDGQFRQVFATYNPADTFGDRSEYDLVDMGSTTRIYLGDSSDDLSYSVLWRTDNASVPAGQLLSGASNSGWILLSSPTNGTPGFGSYFFCHAQCGYDMFVVSPPGQPDTVWLGGAMNYDELPVFGGNGRSNGRAVVRSTDAGVTVTDMTNDGRNPPLGMHPDQHAIVFSPADPNIAFAGSDGGVIRTSGSFIDDTAECAGRPITKADLTDCNMWLSAVPSQLLSLNDGLATMQFQSLSVNLRNPTADLMGGTQDNGTWLFSGSPTWLETIDGDGGQSGYDAVDPNIRVHTYNDATPDVSFTGGGPGSWNWIGDPLLASHEARAFYVPLITDPVVPGSMFVGMQHVWRTQDSGGSRPFLEANCNEYTGTFTRPCGDWQAIGGVQNGDLTSTLYGTDKAGNYVAAVERAAGDHGTLWAGTRVGRVFVSRNAGMPRAQDVTYTRIDTSAQPGRFVSGIAIDPADANHAFVSFSGYEAYTPDQPGHVFEVRFDPATSTATWTDRSYNIGDQPVTDVALDSVRGDL